MKSSYDRRIVGFIIIMLLGVSGLVYAAVPNDTLRTTVAGVSTLVVDYLNSTRYYIGGTEVTGYIQNANPAGDANFSSVEADNLIVRGNINATQLALYPQQPASYIIWKSGSTYYAKDGTDGNIAYSGGTAHTVVNNAITSATGGKIFITAGNYTIISPIVVLSNTTIEGEGKGTHLHTTVNNRIFMITGTAMVHKENVAIRNMYLSGTGVGDTQSGVTFQFIEDSIIEGLWVEDMGRDGIQLLQDSLRCIVSSNIVRNCEDDGISLNDAEQNIIIDNQCEGMTVDGIHVVNDSNENTVVGNICNSNEGNGIKVSSITVLSNNNAFISNICKNNTNHGIFLEAGSEGVIDGDICIGNGGTGIYLSSFDNAIISNNLCKNNTLRGIYCSDSSNIIITGNKCQENTIIGIKIYNSENNSLTGNTCYKNIQHGIELKTASNNLLVGNTCNGNDANKTATYSGINIDSDSDDNLVHSNICNDNDKYGIKISNPNCERNWLKNNQLQGNTARAFYDLGTDTRFSTLTLSFIEGTTLLSTAPFGWEIDANTEYALALGTLPAEVQMVAHWKIWATSVVNEADSMTIQIQGYGGGDNEAYTTETVNIATLNSTSTNFAANDVIYWTVTHSNDPDLDDMFGGDQIMIKVLHEAASGGACATDAIFTCIEIDYV